MRFDVQHITAQAAEDEPEQDRIFGPDYEKRQSRLRAQARTGINCDNYRPWEKPTVARYHQKLVI